MFLWVMVLILILLIINKIQLDIKFLNHLLDQLVFLFLLLQIKHILKNNFYIDFQLDLMQHSQNKFQRLIFYIQFKLKSLNNLILHRSKVHNHHLFAHFCKQSKKDIFWVFNLRLDIHIHNYIMQLAPKIKLVNNIIKGKVLEHLLHYFIHNNSLEVMLLDKLMLINHSRILLVMQSNQTMHLLWLYFYMYLLDNLNSKFHLINIFLKDKDIFTNHLQLININNIC